MKTSLPQRMCVCLLMMACMSSVIGVRADSITDLIARMPLEDRVGQMLMIRFWGNTANSAVEQLIDVIHPGAVVLIKPNFQMNDLPRDTTALTNGLQQMAVERFGIPLLIATDQEGGKIQRLREGFTDLPSLYVPGAVTDRQTLLEYGALAGAELRAVGVNMTLAPGLDLATSPNNYVMRGRMYGDDPAIVSEVTNAIINGFSEVNVITTAKHFPGHGDVSDTHVAAAALRYDLTRLLSTELLPFARTTAPVIMLGHISAPALDPSGLPATLSPAIINFLRRDLKYNGVLLTDSMDMGAIRESYLHPDAVVMTVRAGADMVLLGSNVTNTEQIEAHRALVNAVRSGQIPEVQINVSVERILRLKQRFGLLRWQPLDVPQAPMRLQQSNGTAVMHRVFSHAVTVLINTADVVPVRSSASVGLVYPRKYPEIGVACGRYAGDRLRSLEVADSPARFQIGRAVALANESDVIIVFTEDAIDDAAQQNLIHALPPDKAIVVALKSPYDVRVFPQVRGYVLTYEPDPASVEAACAVLFGAQPATGRLPVRISAQYPAGSGGVGN